jgi:hypothetical protein
MGDISRSCKLLEHHNSQKKEILMGDISKQCDLFWDGISKKEILMVYISNFCILKIAKIQ